MRCCYHLLFWGSKECNIGVTLNSTLSGLLFRTVPVPMSRSASPNFFFNSMNRCPNKPCSKSLINCSNTRKIMPKQFKNKLQINWISKLKNHHKTIQEFAADKVNRNVLATKKVLVVVWSVGKTLIVLAMCWVKTGQDVRSLSCVYNLHGNWPGYLPIKLPVRNIYPNWEKKFE